MIINEDDYSNLVKQYQYKIVSVIQPYVKDRGKAEELSQEVFIKAYNNLHKFKENSSFYTWLYRIAVNTAKNYLIAQKRRPPDSDIVVEKAEGFMQEENLKDNNSPEDILIAEELSISLNKVLDSLPEYLKRTLLLREVDGMSYAEIALETSCLENTVKSRLHRARKLLNISTIEK